MSKCELMLPDQSSLGQYIDRELYESIQGDPDSGSTKRLASPSISKKIARQQTHKLRRTLLLAPLHSREGISIRQNSIEVSPQIAESIKYFREAKSISEEQPPIQVPKKASFSKVIVYFHSLNFARKLLGLIKPESNYAEHHYNLINDLASSYQPKRTKSLYKRKLVQSQDVVIDWRVRLRILYRNWCQELSNKGAHFYLSIPLIDPSSNYKFLWDMILCLIRIYSIVIIPILMSASAITDRYNLNTCFIISFFLQMDIIFRAFTIQFDQGIPIKDHYQLARSQLNFNTVIEISGNITLLLFSSTYSSLTDEFILHEGWPKICLLLILPQLYKLLILIQTTQDSLNLSRYHQSIVELIKLVMLILLIQHFCSCIWYYMYLIRLIVGQYEVSIGEPSWLTPFYKRGFETQYLNAFYFISVTMFTVGYGDVAPQNSSEKIFCIIYMFLCTLQLSYSVNTIGGILTQLRESSENVRQKIIALNQYMQAKKISYPLQLQVREYFNFFYKQEQVQQSFEQNEIIQLLPEDLQQSIKVEAAQNLMIKCSFFQNFSNESQKQLLQSSEFHTFQPGIIINNKTLNIGNDQYVCIIEQGLVDIYKYRYDNKQIISTLKQYEYFGLQEFLNQQESQQIYKSASFTSLLVITYQNFYQILKQKQNDLEIFYSLKNSNPSYFCYICRTHKHLTENCQLIHYSADIEKVIKKQLFYQDQDRRQFIRNRHRPKNFFNAYNDNDFVVEAAHIFQMDNEHQIGKSYPEIGVTELDTQPEQKHISLNGDRNDDSLSLVIGNQTDEVQNDNPKFLSLKQEPEEKKVFFTRKPSMFLGIRQDSMAPDSQNRISEYTNRNRYRTSPKMQSQIKIFNAMAQRSQANISTPLRQQMQNYNGIQYDQLKALKDLNIQIMRFAPLEQEQIWFTVKKIENQIFDRLESQTFETIKIYEIYETEWNLDKILKRKTNIVTNKINRYSRYLLAPYQFSWMSGNNHEDKNQILRQKQIKTGLYKHSKEKRFIRRSKAKVFPER